MTQTEELVAVDGLTVRVGSRGGQVTTLIEDVGFNLRRSEIVCLVGESGSGKSVTARTIMGLTQLDPAMTVSGNLRYAGEQIRADAVARLRGRGLAMVFQDPMSSLDPLHTVGAQLAESLRRRHGRLDRGERRARMEQLLADVGIYDAGRVLRSHPHELSGGMCQRVMIASALATDPSLLIADEPTTALDVTIQAQIIELLDRLRTERGMAVLLVTHDMGVAAEIADRVVVMYSGRIVEDAGTLDAFLDPRHPYTHGLLQCTPRLTGDRPTLLSPIPGTVPDPASRPAGCSFHPRCAVASDECGSEAPGLVGHADRRYACWNPVGNDVPLEGAR